MGKHLLFFFTTTLVIFYLMMSNTFAQSPVVTDFSPAKGAMGSTVVINGSNFIANTVGNIVYFGATRAVVTAASTTSLNVTVPPGSTFEPISVLNTTTHLTGYSKYPFHTTFSSKGTITALDFDRRVDFNTGSSPTTVAVGDLDGDGKPEMVVANSNTNTLSVYKNISVSGTINATSFAPKFDIATNFTPSSAELGDLDGDGKLDIAVVNNTSGNISIFRNRYANGNLNASSFDTKVDFATSSTPAYLKIGDLDGDGKPDLAVSYSYVAVSLSLFKNNSTTGSITSASFGPRIDLATGNGYFFVNIADLNNNGKPELILADALSARIHVYNNVSTTGILNALSFEPRESMLTANVPLAVNPGDIDGDGKTDLVVSNFGQKLDPNPASGFFMSILLNKESSASFNSSSFIASNFEANAIPQSSAVSDFDGDGKLDVVTSNYQDNNISIFHSKSIPGSPIFDARLNFAAGVGPQNVKCADLDGDGKPDIIVTNGVSNTVSVFRNNASSLQNLTFTALQPVVYGTKDFNASALSNNPNNPIIYSSSDPVVATISATGLIHTTGVGVTTITVSQPGVGNLSAATPISQQLVVTPAALTIKVDNQTKKYNEANPVLTATYAGLVNGDMASSIGANIVISTLADATSAPGVYPVTITGNSISANYTITYLDGTLTVEKLNQTIVFNTIDKQYIGINFTLNATASSGLSVTYSISDINVATVSGNVVNPLSTGRIIITATQPGNDFYNAVSATQPVLVLSSVVTIVSNTITPNADGINDIWIIKGLEYDLSSMVSIFNRYGKVVFQSKGYSIPFNGQYNGKKLPAGVYFYKIDLLGKPPLSGSLTILY